MPRPHLCLFCGALCGEPDSRWWIKTSEGRVHHACFVGVPPKAPAAEERT